MVDSVIYDIDENTKKLLDEIPIPVLINIEEKILFANKMLYSKTGYDEKSIYDIKFTDLFKPEHKEIFLARTQKRLKGDISSLPEKYNNIPIVTKNNNILYYDIYPNIFTDGNITATIYISVDKTMYIKNEKALEEFFEYCPTVMYIRDKDHRFIKVSKQFENVMNKSSMDIVGKSISDLWSKEEADYIIKEDDIVINKKIPIILDKEYDGRHLFITKFPINGDLIGGINIDITDKVKSQEKLEISNKKYEELYNVLLSLLDSMQEMMWLYDKDKNILFANKALKNSKLDKFILNSNECMLLSEEREIFTSIYNVDGKDINVEIIKNPLFNEEGKLIGCSGSVKDITSIVLQQNQIIKKLKRLENETIKETKDVINMFNSTINSFNKKWGGI